MHIAVVQIWGLGDLIMTMPVIAEIQRRHPDAHLSAIVRGKPQAALLKDSGLRVDVIDMPARSRIFEFLKFLLELRRRRIDVAYIGTRITPLAALLLRVACAVRTVIGDSERFYFLYTHRGVLDPHQHRVDRMLETLSLWDGKTCRAPSFSLRIAETAEADAIVRLNAMGLSPRRFVAIHPGSGRGRGYREKRLPPSMVHGLITEINRDFPDYRVAVILGPDDVDLRSRFTSLPSDAVIVDGVPLDTTKAILSKCSAFVGSDSALGHISAAFGVPTITVAGPTRIDESRPYGTNSTVVKRTPLLACQPCWNTPLHGHCPYNAACIADLSVDSVYGPLRDLLRDRRDEASVGLPGPAPHSA